MRPRRLPVHLRRRHCSVSLTLFEQLPHVFEGVHDLVGLVLQEDASLRVFSDLQVLFLLGVEQVVNVFVINLSVRTDYLKGDLFGSKVPLI